VAGYVPTSSYLVVATPAAMVRVAALQAVTWSARMKAAHKVAPELAALLAADARTATSAGAALNPKLSTLNPKPQNPKSYTLNPKP